MCSAAIKRLSLYGLLALAPFAACAQRAPQFAWDRPGLASEEGDEVDAAALLSPMQSAAPPTRNVRKLSDGELTCAQIYAETQALEKSSQAQQAEATQAQAAMTETQNEMMKSAGSMPGSGIGSAIGNSLLGMIPGAGQIQGYAMQAAAEARRASMQDSAQKMMQAQTQLMKLEQGLEHAQARSDHLADLFLKKGCKLSEVKAATANAAP
ncbi:hypothetical protein [Hydrogenophaga sp. 2FB]|uniref:hypothetical protein n=1 Tax=Hydrogenophaga sp. 2FB TaxID=2502187 RepID=UPI0010F484A5|nr:hypothetical protein [Hydrogenophaga sp. 2FB]